MRWKLSPVIIVLGYCLVSLASSRAQSNVDQWRTQHNNAVAAFEQGRYPEAASSFLEAIRLGELLGSDDVRLAESLNGLAQTYRYQQKNAEAEVPARRAMTILERALGPAHSGLLPSLINLAGVARASARHAQAEQLHRRILSLRWGTPTTKADEVHQVLEKFAEVLSLAYTRDPGLDTALAEYARLIGASRLDKDLYIGMQDGLIAVSLVREAELLLEAAIRFYPDSRQLHYQLGELYASVEKHEKAITAYERAARVGAHPDMAEERRRQGRIFERIAEMNFFLVRFDEGFTALGKALQNNPASIKARLQLGALYLRRNKLDEAAAEYAHVVSITPGHAAAHDGLAQVNLARGRYADVVRNADAALSIDPGLQTSRYARAMALIRDGRGEEGRLSLQEYQRREEEQQRMDTPRNELAELDRASSALFAEGKLPEGIELLRKGIQAHPAANVFYLKLGLAQSRLQQHRAAADTFETIIRLRLDDFLVHRQLSREYELLGDPEKSLLQRVIYLQRYDAALLSKVNG